VLGVLDSQSKRGQYEAPLMAVCVKRGPRAKEAEPPQVNFFPALYAKS
jgi:hypothetical protein